MPFGKPFDFQSFSSYLLIECAIDPVTESVAAYLSFLIPEALITTSDYDSKQFLVKLLVGSCHFCLFCLALTR